MRNTTRSLLALVLTLTITAGDSLAQSAPPPFREIGHQGLMHFIVATLPAIRDRVGAQAYARRLCTGQNACFVHFWTDERRAARAVPMTDAQADAMVASYNINHNSGYDQFVCYNFGTAGEKCA
jgi:hypothetical protein